MEKRELLKTYRLSDREIEIASAVGKGLCSKEVGAMFDISEKTVKFHLSNIYKKMRIKSRIQLVCIFNELEVPKRE